MERAFLEEMSISNIRIHIGDEVEWEYVSVEGSKECVAPQRGLIHCLQGRPCDNALKPRDADV